VTAESQKSLGPYRLQRLIGRGGMGTVYAAVHEESGQVAAIKLLSMGLADDDNFRARFLVEIETLKQLHHPNIVQILGDGEQDGQLFYVMELIEGQSLQDILQQGHTFDFREVTRIAIEVCAALKHAHDSGVIHRDLKPANLLLNSEGHIKLTDFGIAKLFGASHRTADGSVVGTADFMAPEQADSRAVTNRTDLYGLGAVMFTLLTRRTPFQGGTLPQVVHKLKYEEAPSVRRYVPQVPEELDLIISELLRKDPQQRVATALVLANRLRALEHAILARHESVLPPDAQPTRLAPVVPNRTNPRDKTRMGPTHVDTANISNDGDGDQWDESMIKTSELSGDLGSLNTETAVELQHEETRTPQNRFTTLAEDQLRRAERTTVDAETKSGNLSKVLGLGVLLMALVAVCAWAMWPPSADAMYQRIQAITRDKGAEYASKEMDIFLEKYPHDRRGEEIKLLRTDVECDFLESRLRLRKRKTDGHGLQAYEQQWLEAYLIRNKDPKKAIAIWESIMATEGQDKNPSASLQTILDATRHQLKRMKPVGQDERKT
jgi:serine/threonine protein kinase